MQYRVEGRRLIRSDVSPVFDRFEDGFLPGDYGSSLEAIHAGQAAIRAGEICCFGIHRIAPTDRVTPKTERAIKGSVRVDGRIA